MTAVAELRRLFGLNKADKLVYIYIGRYGQNDLDWSRLQRFDAQGIHFLGYQPVPAGSPKISTSYPRRTGLAVISLPRAMPSSPRRATGPFAKRWPAARP